eukprot:TRINITY_DN16128_c0_g1_i1.p1 TRINITY_DN16128_c0_g1~~TRINITY_DN16128_c0_g1_i1.p1  ORF type:complete len:250 (+),score=36.88 TRINITY_DN16128_c0_g1_i1:56-805(+)
MFRVRAALLITSLLFALVLLANTLAEADNSRQLTEAKVGGGRIGLARAFRLISIIVPGAAAGGDASEPSVGASLFANLLLNLVSVLLQCAVAACIYSSFKDIRVTSWKAPPTGDFPNGIFDCCADPQIAVCGCCCPALRGSQTQHMAGLRQFWTVFLLSALLLALPTWIGLLAFACYRFKLRTELRAAAGLKQDNCMDCLCVFCCGFCAICQEANFVKTTLAGGIQGDPAYSAPQVVGEPTVITSNGAK